MDRGGGRATVHGLQESNTTEQPTISYQIQTLNLEIQCFLKQLNIEATAEDGGEGSSWSWSRVTYNLKASLFMSKPHGNSPLRNCVVGPDATVEF